MKDEWISTKSRLPQENKRVLIFCEEHILSASWFHHKGDIIWISDPLDLGDVGIRPDNVTHWMNLPTPPKSC